MILFGLGVLAGAALVVLLLVAWVLLAANKIGEIR